MMNLEHYKNEVLNYNGDESFCDAFVRPIILKQYGKECNNIPSCGQCTMMQMIWAQEEYKEPETDWSTVKVDTPILVSRNGEDWYKRYFAKYQNGFVSAWNDGKTSFSMNGENYTTAWKYGKLAEVEE